MNIRKHCAGLCLGLIWAVFAWTPLQAQSIFSDGFEGVSGAAEIEVRVAGLAGRTIALQLNGAETLSFTGDGQKKFASTVPIGQPFSVVLTQPPATGNACQLTDASGTATAAVMTVNVNCSGNANVWDVMLWDQGTWQ